MSKELEQWAIAEKAFIQDEIKWLKAGTKVISPSGENITNKKLEELAKRLEHARKVLGNPH